jgi:antitoxin CptB
MTGTTRSSADLDARRRRALFRSWHRGIREMDLVLGAFADHAIGGLTLSELEQYEALMDVPDADLLNWVTGQAQIPPQYDTPLFRKILASRPASPVHQP